MVFEISFQHFEEVIAGEFPDLASLDRLRAARVRKVSQERGLAETLTWRKNALNEFLTIRTHDEHLDRTFGNLIIVCCPGTFVKQGLIFPEWHEPRMILL